MIPLGTFPELVLTFLIGATLAAFFGLYVADVYTGRSSRWDRVLLPIERGVYRLLGVDPQRGMSWKEYVRALVITDGLALLFVFVLLQVQQGLPWNPLGAPNMSWDLAFHTAASFTTNTDYQHYVPEKQASLFASLFGLQTLMFMSPTTGLCVFAAFSRGFARRDGKLGNFYADVVRTLTRILIPVTILGAFALVLLGVPETLFVSVAHVLPLGGGTETVPLGPVAGWDSIEFVGSNGGGYFSANAAHPFQNPSSLTNFVAIVLMMLLPFGAPFAFARIVRRPGEAWPLIGTILIVFLIGIGLFLYFEGSNSYLPVQVNQGGGYVLGAESRFTISESALFQFTSVFDNVGATSMALASLTPIAQTTLLFGMFTQSTPGGVGTGFGFFLIYVTLAVFMGGLMVGRSPEYLGKKISMGEVKWAAAALLSHPFAILLPLAVTFISGNMTSAIGGYSPHGFTILLYEFTSESANNGSGMSPINDGTPFFNVIGALIMLFGRYFPILAMLAIAGSLATQRARPPGLGTLKTESLTFTIFLALFLIIVTALLFLPVLALGPFSQIVGAP
ncbi:MAG TPA: potassium-transporting ATPase subunit KdpA [Thermoplasmata archaeon]|nr:potassium-transporting ATPase subunit KdpA [Thermoplasmata archaeon]